VGRTERGSGANSERGLGCVSVLVVLFLRCGRDRLRRGRQTLPNALVVVCLPEFTKKFRGVGVCPVAPHLTVCVCCVCTERMNPYEQAGVPRATLHRALRQLGPGALKAGLRAAWSSDNPTKNYCYYVTEMLFRYAPACKGYLPYVLKIERERELHRFLRHPDGSIMDLTAEQFGGRALDYGPAQQQNFRSPSRLAHELAELCGLEPEPWPERETKSRRPAPPSGVTIPGAVANDLLAFLRVQKEQQGHSKDVAAVCAAAGFTVAPLDGARMFNSFTV
jgi:hypothetical protein